jgi:Transposase DDE domain
LKRRLVNRAKENVRVKRVLADGAYDSRANFRFLSNRHIKPIIRVRSNSVPKSKEGVPGKEDARSD